MSLCIIHNFDKG